MDNWFYKYSVQANNSINWSKLECNKESLCGKIEDLNVTSC